MAPVIHLVNEQLGLSYTMIVLAGSVALAIAFALLYKKPGKKVTKDQEKSDLCFFHENVKIVKISTKTEKDFSIICAGESTLQLNIEEPRNEDWASGLVNSYGKMFSSPAMAVMLGKPSNRNSLIKKFTSRVDFFTKIQFFSFILKKGF